MTFSNLMYGDKRCSCNAVHFPFECHVLAAWSKILWPQTKAVESAFVI